MLSLWPESGLVRWRYCHVSERIRPTHAARPQSTPHIPSLAPHAELSGSLNERLALNRSRRGPSGVELHCAVCYMPVFSQPSSRCKVTCIGKHGKSWASYMQHIFWYKIHLQTTRSCVVGCWYAVVDQQVHVQLVDHSASAVLNQSIQQGDIVRLFT